VVINSNKISGVPVVKSNKSKLADLDDFGDTTPALSNSNSNNNSKKKINTSVAPPPIKTSDLSANNMNNNKTKLAELDDFDSAMATSGSHSKQLLYKISVPADKYARVLGKNHCNMRAIRELTGCVVEPQDRERVVVVRHVSSAAAATYAAELLQTLIADPDIDLGTLLLPTPPPVSSSATFSQLSSTATLAASNAKERSTSIDNTNG
jgi:hypothetical protein